MTAQVVNSTSRSSARAGGGVAGCVPAGAADQVGVGAIIEGRALEAFVVLSERIGSDNLEAERPSRPSF